MQDNQALVPWLADQLTKTHDLVEPGEAVHDEANVIGVASPDIQKLFTITARAAQSYNHLDGLGDDPDADQIAIAVERMRLTGLLSGLGQIIETEIVQQFRLHIISEMKRKPRNIGLHLRAGFKVEMIESESDEDADSAFNIPIFQRALDGGYPMA